MKSEDRSTDRASRGPAGLRAGLTSYGDDGFSLFLRRAFIKGAGYSDDALERPIIGIATAISDYNPCHGANPGLVAAVRRGVMLAGGLPMEFPTVSVHESFSSPTSMLLRNLMSMDVEEMIRAQPMDAVVLVGGCDKTVPAQLMGAASAERPTIQLVSGAMLTGTHRGGRVGACTDCRAFWGRHRAGTLDPGEIDEVNSALVGSAGTCSVMGTASTMACVAEALGIALLGSAAPPAVTAARLRVGEATGAAAVDLARAGTPIKQIITADSIENAARVVFAIGGSTNAIIHLTAIAGRLGIPLALDDIDRWARDTPVLVDLKPAGEGYMEDFHRAGGLVTVLHEISDLLHLNVLTVTGRTLGDELERARPVPSSTVVRPRTTPLFTDGGIAVLRGNLAPRGAIIKQVAASPELLCVTGRAVPFDGVEDLALRIDDPELDVRPEDILVLRGAGPVGAPGMPEAGYIPIPRRLAERGVTDMVRISDARMSGTAAGTIVLHITPEAAVGGPLALVRHGDLITLDVPARRLTLDVSEEELDRRRSELHADGQPVASRGYRRLYVEHVMQADDGCDFDFLRHAGANEVL
ncbi:dihydroxy-acid dehydratase [Sphaerisporangium sp. NPDC051011]|uniref:dihydroxy-acid dehydratase n=1 Tax=Sphaerisporangium sp. NPDC051011 TaxID=3155792 RepID=UPI0033C79DAA